ncbi:MAG: phosphorylase family protein [Acidimicrobiales bacterium]
MTAPGGPGAPGSSATVTVLAAMETEIRPLIRSLSLAPTRVDGLRAWTGTVRGAAVLVATIGVGPATAGPAAARILEATEVGRVLVAGVSGAVDPALSIADVVLPQAVIDRSSGRSYQPTAPPGTRPSGTLLTCSELVTGPDEAMTLQAGGVTAVDMETAAVAAVCERYGCRWSVYRAISDRVSDGVLDAAMISLLRPDGRIDPGAATRLVARHPASVRRLVRLGIDTRAAVAALTRAVRDDLHRAVNG